MARRGSESGQLADRVPSHLGLRHGHGRDAAQVGEEDHEVPLPADAVLLPVGSAFTVECQQGAAVIREPIAAQSALRLDKFEQAVGWKPVHPSPGARPYGPNRPAHEIKRFIDKRAESVRRQLDGKSKGMILKYPKEK